MEKTYVIRVKVNAELTEYSDIEQALYDHVDVEDVDLLEVYED